MKEGRTKEAIEAAAALAKHPNVYLKVSAAPVYSHEGYPFRDLDAHIKRLIDAYGPKRCFWGTDLSHALHHATYRQCVTHFTEALTFLSRAGQGMDHGARPGGMSRLADLARWFDRRR